MRFFAAFLIAAPHAISVGEISVRHAAAAGFLDGTQVGQGQSIFLLFQVIYLIPMNRAFDLH